MVNIFARNEKSREVCEVFIECLRDYPLFSQDHSVLSGFHSGGLSVSYWTVESQQEVNQTKLDIQLYEKIGDVLYFNIRNDLRRQGFGRSLYGSVERFFSEMGCGYVVTNPSGQGREGFWEKMGFIEESEFKWTKVL